MIDLDILKDRGYSQEKMRSVFSAEEKPEQIEKLIGRMRNRIQEGVSRSLRDHKLYYALDLAWNAPLRQISPTLLHSLVSKKGDDKSVAEALDSWGVSHLIEDHVSAKGETTQALNLPRFYQIFVPLVKAYVTIRWARIFNDRNLVPLFKYEPHKSTQQNRVKGEIVTDRVQIISQQYDYSSVLSQSIFQMLHYGYCLQFPKESWHSEKQTIRDEDGEEKEVYTKEGIRYHTPHPARTFWDIAHRPSSFNSDTGCKFSGYWAIQRYGDVANNKMYYNTDKVAAGSIDWLTSNANFGLYVNSGYSGTVKFLQKESGALLLDREKDVQYYTSEHDDYSVLVTEYFEKLNPKKMGLFDYDHDVWFRFCVAQDDTVIYAEPLPYCPVVYYGYDSNELQTVNPSLSLEILPFQDHVGNLLTQYLLSIKQNLTNMTFVDEDQVGGDTVEEINDAGQNMYSTLNFVGYSSRKARVGQHDPEKAFTSFKFPQQSTTEIINGVRSILDILERVLVLSAQEVGAAASHEQTAEEVRSIASYTSNRLQFTSSSVDRAVYAWKTQIYNGLMAYGEPEFYAQLQTPVTRERLERLGFTVEDADEGITSKPVVAVKDKTAISLESFSSVRDGMDRINNPASANVMAQLFGAAMSNPLVAQVIGPEQAVGLLNQIFELSGVPRDFRLKMAKSVEELQAAQEQQGEGGGQNVAAVQEQLMGQLQEAAQVIQQQVAEQLAQNSEAVRQQVLTDVSGLTQQIAGQAEANANQLLRQAQVIEQIAAQVGGQNASPEPPPPTALDTV
tara:strand:- start:1983 stop:4343 length:2361 start_codon:yes stop_codon:yes gene_type:complete